MFGLQIMNLNTITAKVNKDVMYKDNGKLVREFTKDKIYTMICIGWSDKSFTDRSKDHRYDYICDNGGRGNISKYSILKDGFEILTDKVEVTQETLMHNIDLENM